MASACEYEYLLELPDGSKIYTSDDQFMEKVLKKHKNGARDSAINWKFIGELETKHLSKCITHEIFESEKSYKIMSSQSKNPTICVTVAKEIVTNVYYHLKKSGRKLSASAIGNALHISTTTIHNVLKVLRCEGKASLDMSGNRRQYLYKAL